MNKEVVADKSQAEPQVPAEDSSAQADDLDTILSNIDKEFDESTKETPDPPEKDETGAKVDLLLKRDEEAAVSNAVSNIQGILTDLDVKLPDRAVHGMLNQIAIEDPRVVKAFENRYSDPKTFNKVLDGVAKTIHKDFGEQPDRQLTNDREAVASVVRGTKTVTEDETPAFNTMTDNEFEEWKRKNR